jgi:hypothetical protein
MVITPSPHFIPAQQPNQQRFQRKSARPMMTVAIEWNGEAFSSVIAMNTEITIVNRGRGMQLSTSRITVQDLVPYFQSGSSYEEIMEAMPTLSVAEIQVVERYIDEHREQVMEIDRQIRERNASRRNPPQVEEIMRRAREKRLALQARLANGRLEDRNGEGHPG